jgi:hypothetical protein
MTFSRLRGQPHSHETTPTGGSMGAVEFRVWSTYAVQAKDHRERAARFRRYADEASNAKNRETYLRVVRVEENLAAAAERLGKEFQTDPEV